ncbi:hypothetical protein SHIRM173S_12509 [Streptomyces hirsutus]
MVAHLPGGGPILKLSARGPVDHTQCFAKAEEAERKAEEKRRFPRLPRAEPPAGRAERAAPVSA